MTRLPMLVEKPTPRLASIDAYRGLVMLLMMAEALQLHRVAEQLPHSRLWQFLAHHQEHVPWIGCSLHDLIQPSFSFLVGVALPFSLAKRAGAGQSAARRTLHAWSRAALLVLLGVFLRSVGQPQTNWTFEDTLTQIGLGYGVLYHLAGRTRRVQAAALAAILVGYWLLFACYPAPAAGFDGNAVGVAPDSPGRLAGFAAHWSINANAAWAFDRWLLNLFPRTEPFIANGGGYSTLSFLPTLGTMILGLLAGQILRDEAAAREKIRRLVTAGVVLLLAGWTLGAVGLCPVVKRIWTPSWTLFSGGWCWLLLAWFYALVDVAGRRAWAYPLVVVGANSLAAYLIAHLWEGFLRTALLTHVGADLFRAAGPAYEPLLLGAAVLAVEWLLLWQMYRRKLFFKI